MLSTQQLLEKQSKSPPTIFQHQKFKKVFKKNIKNNLIMNGSNYLNEITKQSQTKFNRLKEKMLEPIKQVQQSRQQNLKNLLTEIEKKQNQLQATKENLIKLCQE